MVTDIVHDDILTRRNIEAFLDYYDSLVADSGDEDYTPEEQDSFLDLVNDYDESAVDELRDMIKYTDTDSFVSESYWSEYAAQEADDLLLYGVDESVRRYFDYDAWASDLQGDYSAFQYDGVTYYGRD